MKTNIQKSRFFTLFALIISGEMIFSLPFHLTRFFRPTLLEVFSLTNSDLGDAFAIYGIAAMLAYFPGGFLADRYSIRLLMTGSLLATALGGIYLLTIPDSYKLSLLYGYWGISSILFFWAALIKATRQWGGVFSQGKAFGFLDGGRGMAAAIFATVIVWIFSTILPENKELISNSDRIHALQIVIVYYTCITFLTGLILWFTLPLETFEKKQKNSKTVLNNLKFDNVTIKKVFLISTTIICAYCGYKGLDNISLYLTQVLNWHEASAAGFAAYSTYLRPVGAITAGLIADRYDCNKTIGLLFLLSCLAYLFLFLIDLDSFIILLIYANLLVTFLTVFALRGIYFALMEDANLPINKTGMVVGIVSLVGYTPDIFFSSVTGRILDQSPGLIGHQNYYLLLFFISVLGIVSSFLMAKLKIKDKIA